MCDPVGPEIPDLLPDRVHQFVGDLLVRNAIERRPVDHLVREQHGVRTDIDDAAQPRGADSDVTGEQRDERLVLDRSPQRREGPIVTDVLEAQEPVDPKHQVGGALL